MLEKFIPFYSPSEIGAYEKQHHYVWITLAPFAQLPLATTEEQSVMPQPNEGSCSRVQRQYCFSSAAKLGLFSLCHLTQKSLNQNLFKREKLLDSLVCIRWFSMNCKEISNLVPDLMEMAIVEPPRLQAIAKAYLAKCYGYKIT